MTCIFHYSIIQSSFTDLTIEVANFQHLTQGQLSHGQFGHRKIVSFHLVVPEG